MLDVRTADAVRVVADQMSRSFARRFGCDRDDLAQQAWVVALDAARTFDANRGRIENYLASAVRRRLADYCVRQACPVHLSNHAAVRRASQYRAEPMAAWVRVARGADDPEARAILRQAVRRAAMRMSPRSIAVLAASCGARAPLGGSTASIRKARCRGRAILREELAA